MESSTETISDIKYALRLNDMGYRFVIATRDIRMGETIMFLPQVTQSHPDRYSIEIMPGIHVDCSQGAIGAINHSCNPNAAIRKNRLVAWTCIKSREEITLDYKKTESKLAFPFDCNCGNRCCRGRIK